MRVLIRELFETVILALLIFLMLHVSVQNYRVQGPSMQPTLVEGEYVIVNKMVYLRFDPTEIADILPFYDREDEGSLFPFHGPDRGDVIIFRFPRDPSRDFVKRVIGMPGDIIEIDDGDVIRNGELLDEPYITHGDNSNMSPVHVEPDTYFVLGDNRRASNDSRDWGLVPVDNVIGRALVSFWPLNQWHALQAWLPSLY